MNQIRSEDFNLPPEFVMPGNHKAVGDSDGVSRFDYGQQGYVAWRFAMQKREWKEDKVKKYRLEGSDDVPVILFYRDKDNIVPIKLRRRMDFEEQVNRYGEPFDKAIPVTLEEGQNELDAWELPIGFDSEMFQIAFEKFKEQGADRGTPIANWRATEAQASTLAALGIFSVEAFGRLEEDSVKKLFSKLPAHMSGPYFELHELAVAFCNTQAGVVDAAQFGEKIEALEDMNEKLAEDIENKDAEIERLKALIKGTDKPKAKQKSKSKAKSKAVEVRDGVIEGVN